MLTVPVGVHTAHTGRRFNSPLVTALDIRRLLARQRPDVVLVWSGFAAAAARMSGWTCGGSPMVVIICDPGAAGRWGEWWRSVRAERDSIDLLCLSQTIRRRLVESGVPLSATAVIRPGVDFAAVRRARESFGRGVVGLGPRGRVLLTASPPSRVGGQFYAVWAAAILHHIWPDACLVIPGTSREQRRICRLIDTIYCPQIYFPTANRFTPAQLVAISDMLIVPAVGDVPTGWLAWAMAAGVPVVGSAVPTVAEVIKDRHNGFLCQPGEPHTLATRIKTAAESGDLLRQCVERARSQAYAVFRAERCVDEYLKVIRNLRAGRRAVENIHDAAIET